MKAFRLDGRVAVVTGGAGQLGRQFALALREAGALVAILDSSWNDENSIKLPEGVCGYRVDVTNKESLEQVLAQMNSELGVPEVLVNNAALDSPPGAPPEETGPFEDYPEASFDRVMEVNVKGVFLCSQVFGGAMSRKNGGSIINICSIYGMVSPDQRIYEYRRKSGEEFFKPVAYSVSKSALLNMTRYLAVYWAEKKVRVNTMTLAGVFNRQHEDFLKKYIPKVPLGRMADESDYNGALVFLASDASAYMTGSNLVIDGGYTAL